MKLGDSSIMPDGEYKGQKLANIPASYFIWLHSKSWCSEEMQEYIADNIDVFSLELKRKLRDYEE